MGSIENRVKVHARRGEIKTAILQIIAVGGLLTLAVAAPNLPKAVPKSVLEKVFGRPRNARDAAVARLISDDCIIREERNGRRVLRITEKGLRYLERSRRKHSTERPTKWDRKWRFVIFDIKERHRNTRAIVRQELQSIGFKMLQASVWVYPYPCEDFVALLKADARVGKDVLYLVVEELENDRGLREFFDLPA